MTGLSFPLSSLLLLFDRQMDVVYPITGELATVPEPEVFVLGAVGLPAAILAPIDIRLLSEHPGACSAVRKVVGIAQALIPMSEFRGLRAWIFWSNDVGFNF